MGLSAVVSIDGKVVYSRALGGIKKLNFKYEEDTIYDLASLTKPLATSLLLLKLLSKGKIALRDTVGDLGLFAQYHNLKNLSIETLMTHTSGLIPDKPLYKGGKNRASYLLGIDKEAEKQYHSARRSTVISTTYSSGLSSKSCTENHLGLSGKMRSEINWD